MFKFLSGSTHQYHSSRTRANRGDRARAWASAKASERTSVVGYEVERGKEGSKGVGCGLGASGYYQEVSGRDRRGTCMDDPLVYVKNALHFLVEATSGGGRRRGGGGEMVKLV